MTAVTEFHKMKQRRGTSSRWMSTNPELLAGELGLELDAEGNITGVKAGDADSDVRWFDLPYILDTLTNLKLPTVDVAAHQRLAQFWFCAGEPYGNKSAGNVTISASDVVINSYATITGDYGPGSRTFDVTSLPGAFQVGDKEAVHQVQNWRYHGGNLASGITASEGVGYFEYGRVMGIAGTEVTLELPLRGVYMSDGDITGGDASERTVAQLIRVPEYDTLTLSGSITCDPWDGETGGLVMFMADQVLGAGDVDVTGKGFRGVTASTDDTAYWTEGYGGFPDQSFPMTSPELYGSVRAYIDSSGPLLDSFGGSGNLVGSSVHNSALEPITPYYTNFDTETVLHSRAIFGLGAATADVGIPEQAGGGCAVIAAEDVLSWSGSVLAAEETGGAGSVLIYSEDIFPGSVDVLPTVGTYAVYGGNGLSMNVARVLEDMATLITGPSITQTLTSPGASDELASTAAIMTYLAGISGFDSVLIGVSEDVDLTALGTETLTTVPTGKWAQPDKLVLMVQAGSGPKNPPTIKLKAGTTTLLDPVVTEQEDAFTGNVQYVDLNNDMVAPGVDITLEVATASTNDQYLVTAVVLCNLVDYPTIGKVSGDEFETDGVPGANWTVDDTNGTVTALSGELVLTPDLGVPAVECGVITADTFSLTDFKITASFNDPVWAGTNPGGGLRGLLLKLPTIVDIKTQYDEDSGDMQAIAVWQDGSGFTDPSAVLVSQATAFRVTRVAGTVTVEYYQNGWTTLIARTSAAALTSYQLQAYQSDLATAAHITNVEGVLLSNG